MLLQNIIGEVADGYGRWTVVVVLGLLWNLGVCLLFVLLIKYHVV